MDVELDMVELATVVHVRVAPGAPIAVGAGRSGRHWDRFVYIPVMLCRWWLDRCYRNLVWCSKEEKFGGVCMVFAYEQTERRVSISGFCICVRCV